MGLLTLFLVGAASVTFRLGFTVLADPDRLPPSVRERLDVVGPATFGALLATSLAGSVGTSAFVPAVLGLAAAVAAATRTSQLVVPVGAAVAVTAVAAAVLGGA